MIEFDEKMPSQICDGIFCKIPKKILTSGMKRGIIFRYGIEYRGVAQLGDVFERRRWRKKREKRSGSDLPIGELPSNEDRGLVTTGRARGAQQN